MRALICLVTKEWGSILSTRVGAATCYMPQELTMVAFVPTYLLYDVT